MFYVRRLKHVTTFLFFVVPTCLSRLVRDRQNRSSRFRNDTDKAETKFLKDSRSRKHSGGMTAIDFSTTGTKYALDNKGKNFKKTIDLYCDTML